MKLLKKLRLRYKTPRAVMLNIAPNKHAGRCNSWNDDNDSCYAER